MTKENYKSPKEDSKENWEKELQEKDFDIETRAGWIGLNSFIKDLLATRTAGMAACLREEESEDCEKNRIDGVCRHCPVLGDTATEELNRIVPGLHLSQRQIISNLILQKVSEAREEGRKDCIEVIRGERIESEPLCQLNVLLRMMEEKVAIINSKRKDAIQHNNNNLYLV